MFEAQEEEQDGRNDLRSNVVQHRWATGQLDQHAKSDDTHLSIMETEEWVREK